MGSQNNTTKKKLLPNTITDLKAHRLTNKTIHVEHGHLNIIIGERLYTLSKDQKITIPRGTPFAMANLSPSLTAIEEYCDVTTIGDDSAIFSDSEGNDYTSSPMPSTQITLSLYNSLSEMRIQQKQHQAA